MNIGIVGCGVVGEAVRYGFTTNLTRIYTVDPKFHTSINSMYETFAPDVVFVCVPTPTNENGIDSSIIEEVLIDLCKYDHKPIAVIKSTITPDICDKLKLIYPRLVYNPEFITEKNSLHDFVNPSFIILGGNSEEDLSIISEIYTKYSACNSCPIFQIDAKAACLIKYTLNCFMATKLIFFNQIYDIFLKSNVEIPWKNFIEIIATDERIGSTHMSVPGNDGKRGYGGMCFPKDTKAMIHYANDVNISFSVLEEIIKANEKLRNIK